GAGDVTVASIAGAGTARDVTISGSGAVTLGPSTLGTLSFASKTGGTATVTGLTAVALVTGAGGYALTLGGTGIVTNAVAFANAGSLTLGDGGVLQFADGLTALAATAP